MCANPKEYGFVLPLKNASLESVGVDIGMICQSHICALWNLECDPADLCVQRMGFP